MSEDSAKEKARQITQKALAEVDKDLIKPMSYAERQRAQELINKENEKIHRKENKRLEKEMRDSMKNKPAFLVSCAGVLEKLFHTVVTLYSMAGLINIFFCWQIYKIVSAVGWKGIIQTKYSLYILIYFVLLFILKQVYYALYKYAHR